MIVEYFDICGVFVVFDVSYGCVMMCGGCQMEVLMFMIVVCGVYVDLVVCIEFIMFIGLFVGLGVFCDGFVF